MTAIPAYLPRDKTDGQNKPTNGRVQHGLQLGDVVNSQVAIGNYNVQIGAVEAGARVDVIAGPRELPKPRATPLDVRPPDFPGLLDRTAEISAMSDALQSAQPVEVYGPAGIGKTSLLSRLSNHAQTRMTPDGVVWRRISGLTLDDVLQNLFEEFYDVDPRFMPTQTQRERYLRGKRALIFLDDVELGRDDIGALRSTLPGCTFVLFAAERRGWGEGRALALRGLPLEDSLKLMERELGRPLNADESAVAQTLCIRLEGHPLHIIQTASLVREKGRTFTALARETQMIPVGDVLESHVLESLSADERKVMAALALLDGAPLRAEHLAAATELDDALGVAEDLRRRGLVLRRKSRYGVMSGLILAIQRLGEAADFGDRLLEHLIAWAEGGPSFSQIVEEAEALLKILGWAAHNRKWGKVLRLIQLIEAALILGKCWGLWQRVLELAQQAARSLGDRAAEGWALHQAGTRAMCLGDTTVARRSLIRALRLREQLGPRGRIGVEVTRHNLSLILPPPPIKPPKTGVFPGDGTPRGLFWLNAGLIAIAIGLTLALTWLIAQPGFTATPEPTGVPSDVVTSATTTPTPTLSSTPTGTETSTATDTPDPTRTSTATDTAAPTPTITPTRCGPPPGWVVYIVQSGDNLFRLSLNTGTTVRAVQLANCLSTDRINTGQPLYLPSLPPTRTPTPTLTPTLTKVPYPDLVISDWRLTGPATITYTYGLLHSTFQSYLAQGTTLVAQVPMRVIVTNQGNTAAGVFKVVVSFSEQKGSGYAFFTVSGQADPRFPFTGFLLPAGDSVALDGVVTLYPGSAGQDIWLWAIADSCVGDDGFPVYCRVLESDEGNNQSKPIVIPVVDYPPSVTVTSPVDGATFDATIYDKAEEKWYVDVMLEGEADDPEQGLLDGSALVWTTDQANLQDTDLGTGATTLTRLYVEGCGKTTHQITLNATDAGGNAVSASIGVTVYLYCVE